MAKQFAVPTLDSLEEEEHVSVRKYFRAGASNEPGQNAVQPESAPNVSNTPSPASLGSAGVSKPQDNVQSHASTEKTPESLVKVPTKTNTIIVSARQKGNPLLKHIRNVPWEFGDIEPDYIMGQSTCALYLSLRYYNLFPNYIHQRLRSLGKSFEVRILLVQVDASDPHPALRELSQISIMAECTLMLAWSAEEAGRHIETYKVFESKSADLLMEKSEDDVFGKLVDSLSSVKSINRPDAVTLLTSFGTLEKISKASKEELSFHPGMGMQKASRLYDVLHQPFLKQSTTQQ
uniref:DNA excision repair protein ERCC-1 n=2 Tax=Ixodes ricinus TaxID=34613 RepID=A0A6B0V845_IXORI